MEGCMAGTAVQQEEEERKRSEVTAEQLQAGSAGERRASAQRDRSKRLTNCPDSLAGKPINQGQLCSTRRKHSSVVSVGGRTAPQRHVHPNPWPHVMVHRGLCRSN